MPPGLLPGILVRPFTCPSLRALRLHSHSLISLTQHTATRCPVRPVTRRANPAALVSTLENTGIAGCTVRAAASDASDVLHSASLASAYRERDVCQIRDSRRYRLIMGRPLSCQKLTLTLVTLAGTEWPQQGHETQGTTTTIGHGASHASAGHAYRAYIHALSGIRQAAAPAIITTGAWCSLCSLNMNSDWLLT